MVLNAPSGLDATWRPKSARSSQRKASNSLRFAAEACVGLLAFQPLRSSGDE